MPSAKPEPTLKEEIVALNEQLKKFETEPFKGVLEELFLGLVCLALGFLCAGAAYFAIHSPAFFVAPLILVGAILLPFKGMELALDASIKLFSKLVDNTLLLLVNKKAGTELSAEKGYYQLKISTEIACKKLLVFFGDLKKTILGPSEEKSSTHVPRSP